MIKSLQANFMVERKTGKEKIEPISSVLIFGLGQVGRMFCQELGKDPNLRLYGISRQTSIDEEVMAQGPQLLILAIPNPIDQAVAAIRGNIKAPLTVLLPQNGVDAVPKAIVGFADKPVTIVRASLFTPVTFVDDRLIYDRKKLRIALAPVSASDVDVRRIAILLKDIGFQIQVCSDYSAMEWTKLLLNTIGTTGTITGLPPSETFSDQELFYLEIKALKDRLMILQEAGISIINFPWLPTKLIIQILKHTPLDPPDFVRNIFARIIAGERSNLPPASARKIAEGRPTEVFYYHSPFVELGRECGLLSPVDEAILKLVDAHKNRKIDLARMDSVERRQLLLNKASERISG
jgi:ketopantoate reductase